MTIAAFRAKHLTSELLSSFGFTHAFFTREGGVSEPPFASLSFSVSAGDSADNVAENLRRAAEVLGITPQRLCFLSQVHGTTAREIHGGGRADDFLLLEGDVTYSREPGFGCAVRTADCVPILVADRVSGAVAAIHSGWKGTTLDVARAGVTALRTIAGQEADLIAAIGPHIEACCFEVGDDVALELDGCSSERSAVTRSLASHAPHVDLRRIVRAQLRDAGIDDANIDDVAGCTVCDARRFHSYRRDGKRSGRLLSAIVTRSPRQ